MAITQTLKTAAGDFNSLDDVFLDIGARLDVGLGGDDLVYNVQGNQTFSVSSDAVINCTNCFFAGRKITIQTDPADIATPATIGLGSLFVIYAGEGGPTYSDGLFDIQNIKVVFNATSATQIITQFGDGSNNFLLGLKNCLLYISTSVADELFLQTGSQKAIVNNCDIFVTRTSGSLSSLKLDINGGSIIRNSTIAGYSASNINILLQGGIHNNNTLYNYGGGGITEVLSGGATAPDLLKADPGFTQSIIQTPNDSTATMIARDASLASGSGSIGTADPATSELTDILGNSRS